MEEALNDLARAILEDEQGISEEAYNALVVLFDVAGVSDDILKNVRATEGRFYLPE